MLQCIILYSNPQFVDGRGGTLWLFGVCALGGFRFGWHEDRGLHHGRRYMHCRLGYLQRKSPVQLFLKISIYEWRLLERVQQRTAQAG